MHYKIIKNVSFSTSHKITPLRVTFLFENSLFNIIKTQIQMKYNIRTFSVKEYFFLEIFV